MTPTPAARRIARWATNLLASGLVLLVGLVCGREVLVWWHAPPAAESQPAASAGLEPPAWDYAAGVFDLQFGGAPLWVRREPFQGERRAAADRLARHSTELARAALATAPSAAGLAAADMVDATRAANQTAWLAQLAALTPSVVESGQWALYAWDVPLPANVVVSSDRRQILAWGLALPVDRPGEGPTGAAATPAETSPPGSPAWSLFSWTATSRLDGEAGGGATDSANQTGLPFDLPCPSGSKLGLSVRAPDGSGLVSFAVSSSLDQVQQDYRQWARRVDAVVAVPWRELGGLWSTTYRTTDDQMFQVQLSATHDPRRLRGIVTCWPGNGKSRE